MKVSRTAWIVVAVVAAAIAAFTYSQVRNSQPATHSVKLHWKATPGATSYNVYRSTKAGHPYTKIGTSTTPSYVDSPVPSGAVLYYVVTAVHDGQESGFSTEIKAVVP
jgi:fibronectin type 3 domain-containing protein